MEKVNIHDANTHLSQLVERAEAGDAIVIARAGRASCAARAAGEAAQARAARRQMPHPRRFQRAAAGRPAARLSRQPLMRLLLNTHLVLGSMAASRRLPAAVRDLLKDPANTVFYSAASVWEIALKSGLKRRDFRVDLPRLLQSVLEAALTELRVMSTHAARVPLLPDFHKDAFNRLLVAQALAEQALLLTNDSQLGGDGAHVRIV